MFFADNGARVLKIEPPGGDRLRTTMPSGQIVWDRGKDSVVADLHGEAGRQLARDLVATADVVIEAFEPGKADAWGLGYGALSVADPRLIYCEIKAFSGNGPYAAIKGYDGVVMAKAGIFGRGDFAFRPGPIFTGGLLASNGAAHMALAGILSALIVRREAGVGQLVSASLFQGLNPIDYFMSYHYQLGARELAIGAVAASSPAEPPTAPPAVRVPAATRYGATACTKDGRWLTFSPQLTHQAQAMMRALGLEHSLFDGRFKDVPAFWSVADAEAWDELVGETIKLRTLDEWIPLCRAEGDLPFEPILSAEEALDHPQLRHNGDVVSVIDPRVGPIEQVGPVAHFSEAPSHIDRPAPSIDQHRDLPASREPVAEPVGDLPPHPLSGVTIVEFGYFYAMPYGVTMAAALGARVIKVENVDGDPMRWSFGPPEWGGAKTMEGKESICLDLRHEDGRRVLRRLVEGADMFVQGFRPGVADQLGFGYEDVCRINPEIVYVHASGYGSSGPLAHRPIYAGVASAMAGSVHRQAAAWLDPALGASMDALESSVVIAPRLRGVTDGDANAALAVLSAMLLGLWHKKATGEGQFLSTSMIGGNVLAYAEEFNRYEGKAPVPQSDDEQLGISATYRLYPTAEGWVFFAAVTEAEWLSALPAFDRPQLSKDDRFGDAVGRARHDRELAAELEAVFRERPASEWERRMVALGVGCVAVGSSQAEVSSTDDVLLAMSLTAEVDHPLFGSLRRYGPPVAMSRTPGRVAPGSVIGEHTEAILRELGYGTQEIGRLREAGTVRGT
jgi:crotonobetainyl-CoA:carnitine CoA-transferase CaiB-like acyl-CoA transferase